MTSITLHSAKDVFNCVYAHESVREVPFQMKWNNGTGYLDGAVHADLGLQPGELAKFNTGAENNRKGIVIALPGGKNLVIFERYTEGASEVYVSNGPRAVEQMLDLTSRIGDNAMARVFGQCIGERFQEFYLERGNIGTILHNVVEELTETA